MEENINIAAILNDKPNNIKLYSPIFGECTFCCVREDTNDICVKKRNGVVEYFNYEGLYFALGEVMLFPSKSMRDWEKLSWKKGDLLINSCGFQCIFKEWASDDYTKFNGCYSNSRDGYEDVSNAETSNFVKLDNNTAYGYIREIENRCGGVLNLKTLRIEKPKFKDGDVVALDTRYIDSDDVIVESFIIRGDYKYGDDLKYYAGCSNNTETDVVYNSSIMINKTSVRKESLRLATEEEKQQLFSALEKEGKAWDSEKKQIVDLKPKCEFKPFDKVVVRCSEADRWSIDFFSYKVHNGYICTGDAWFGYCLPYNDETAHLIGTTDEWKGGEG